MTKDEVLTELRKAREGYVPGSATRVAYNNAIDLVESIHEKQTQATEPASEEPKPKRKYTRRVPKAKKAKAKKPEIGRNAKPKGKKKDKNILDERYTRIAYIQGMPLEIANPLQIRDVPMVIINQDDDDRIAYKCPTKKETKEWIATTRYANAKGSLTEVLDMMEAGVEPPVKRKYVRKAK